MGRSRKEKLVGNVVSLPTFCDDEYDLLLDSQRKHIRWLVDKGIKEGSGVLLIAGGVGETYMLEEGEFNALADLVVDGAEGETPTMMMVHELSARRAARKARTAADAGVEYILLSPPHYSLPSEDDIFLHHQYVNDAADIGIVLYNSMWAMPQPGYSFSRRLLERLMELENVIGVKWSAPSIEEYVGFQQLYGDRLTFLENHAFFSQGPRFGMKGTIDVWGNVAPRLSLHQWDLLQHERYDEYDELFRKLRFDPSFRPGDGGRPGRQMVADGPPALMLLELLGLDSGPYFPGQAAPSDEQAEYFRGVFESSGLMEWVDWDQSILD